MNFRDRKKLFITVYRTVRSARTIYQRACTEQFSVAQIELGLAAANPSEEEVDGMVANALTAFNWKDLDHPSSGYRKDEAYVRANLWPGPGPNGGGGTFLLYRLTPSSCDRV